MTDNIFDTVRSQFENLISLIGHVLEKDKEIHTLQNKLRRHFNSTSLSYLCSNDFQLMLKHIYDTFTQNDKSTKYYSLLLSFVTLMKQNNIKLSKSRPSSTKTSNPTDRSESSLQTETNVTTSLSNEVESTKKSVNTSNSTSPKQIEPSLLIQDPVVNNVRQMEKVHRLERRIQRLSKIIRELEEKDMSLDEMEDCDLYLVESNLKRKAYEAYHQLAQLKNQTLSAERILDQPVTLTDSDIDQPLIRKALQDMVNRTKYFPCFKDVLDTVDQTNNKYKLNLSADDRQHLAEKSFKIIGEKVKNRRMAEFNDIMKSRLPEDVDIEKDDPALNNIEMEQELLKNEHEAIIKTQKIIDEFSQIDPTTESKNESDSEEKSNQDIREIPEISVEPLDNVSEKSEYEAAETLSSLPPKASIPAAVNKNPIETMVKISVDNNRLQISSIASIPITKNLLDSITPIVRKVQPETYRTSNAAGTPYYVHQSPLPKQRAAYFARNRMLYEASRYAKAKRRKIQSETIIID